MTATDIKEHVSGLTSKKEPIEHGAILAELLKSIEPIDFEKAAFPQIEKMRAKCVTLQQKLINPRWQLQQK